MRCGLIILGILCLSSFAANANLLLNPSFEQPIVTNPDLFQYYYAGNPSIPGWTIVGGSVDVNTSARWMPHDGINSIDLTGVTAGGIYQDVATEIGKTYHLTFWLGGNPEFAGADGGPAIKKATLSWGGSLVDTLSFDVTGKSNFNIGWTQFGYDLKATATTTRLEFDSITSGFSGAMLDDVNLVALGPTPPPGVPLPAAMFGGAFAAALAATRRRLR